MDSSILESGHVRGFSLKSKSGANIEDPDETARYDPDETARYDPDETARYEPSYLDLHFLHDIYFSLPGYKV